MFFSCVRYRNKHVHMYNLRRARTDIHLSYWNLICRLLTSSTTQVNKLMYVTWWISCTIIQDIRCVLPDVYNATVMKKKLHEAYMLCFVTYIVQCPTCTCLCMFILRRKLSKVINASKEALDREFLWAVFNTTHNNKMLRTLFYMVNLSYIVYHIKYNVHHINFIIILMYPLGIYCTGDIKCGVGLLVSWEPYTST